MVVAISHNNKKKTGTIQKKKKKASNGSYIDEMVQASGRAYAVAENVTDALK